MGGFDRVGERMKVGRIIMMENEEKGTFVELNDKINLEKADTFSNMVAVGTSKESLLIFGNKHVHELKLKGERKFTKYMDLI